MNVGPCHTCRFHWGSWERCGCLICLDAFHVARCGGDHPESPCCFYRPW